MISIKGEVSHKFAVILKPKNVCLSGRNKEIIYKFVINYPPVKQNCRLVPLAIDRLGWYGLKLGKYLCFSSSCIFVSKMPFSAIFNKRYQNPYDTSPFH